MQFVIKLKKMETFYLRKMDINLLTKEQFHSELDRLQELYTNDIPEVDDETFDKMVKIYVEKFGENWEKIGAKPRFNEIPLPWFLFSIEEQVDH